MDSLQTKQFRKNEQISLKIEDLTEEGAGVGKVDGFPFFVKDTVPGDVVVASVTRVKKNYAFARLVQIVQPSRDRVDARCPVAKSCGGCQLQELSYERQLFFKENKVRNHLIRIGGFEAEEVDARMHRVIGMEKPFRYRNKAQVPFATDKDGRMISGFYAGRTHAVIRMQDCAIGIAENEQILKTISSYAERFHIPAYNEQTGKGVLRHVLIRKGFHTGQIMVCLVVHRKEKTSLPHQDQLITELVKIKGMASISLNYNRKQTNVIMGETGKTIWGRDVIEDTLLDLRFLISPLSFYQINPVQTEVLYKTVISCAALQGDETVWDLYCGIGTISLALAAAMRDRKNEGGHVFGIEVVEQAVRDARENAQANDIQNVTFYEGKAEELLPKLKGKELPPPDLIVVDPPRKGCAQETLQTMLEAEPGRIIYVSCDSATLARDLRILVDGGYRLQLVQPVDMFPQTVHVETVVLMSKVAPSE